MILTHCHVNCIVGVPSVEPRVENPMRGTDAPFADSALPGASYWRYEHTEVEAESETEREVAFI